MSDWKMIVRPVLAGTRLLIAATALSGGSIIAGEPMALDWETAVAAFSVGEQRSPMVFTDKDAARCRGRWRLHADAVVDGAFPDAAISALNDQLLRPSAMHAIDFYGTEYEDRPTARKSSDEAERLLTQALAGDAAAARTYFEDLGLCSTHPETVGDRPAVAMDAPATVPQPAEPSPSVPAESDFDEPVNQQSLAFIKLFMQQLRDGAPVADLLMPKISFAYMSKHNCAAATTGYVDRLPASDVDTGFPFEATYTWENPDCTVPPELDSIEAFNLKATISQWSQIEVAVEDHNFDVFVLTDKVRNDYLLITIEPYYNSYAVSKIEYRLEIL